MRSFYSPLSISAPFYGHLKLLKDVRAQNVPTYILFLNLPGRKVMIYFCQKGKKLVGHRARFRDHEVHFKKFALF